ncbi:molecular chaperone DnaJ [Wolbachia endosymbiont of Drosophila pseudotakahashii]|uniref:molecular chaperone DnaJ n=1 Tax=Wolbachia endosymbiont of Drosophila pseudotakahashii TaxID=375919 RepID=UPI00222FF36A|nr:molecular chaperone DnaJ [Wolbachia endosymbiont of Drosophila pseudotakahashii]MCX3064650.1 molecular chaperone DnaJ [Wolbachia endosymbiont of Drosophila pseudotakahashii]UZE38475.1 molecular chaperone DnaJ [Wolbachia endosymbiont of Drosophila pseudotakahashii]
MASLTRNQYYSNRDLQNLFSRLEIKAEEVISQEFDDILKLVERSFRKLSLKCHPDKEKDEEKKKIATEKFQKLSADKKELEKHLNALKEGKTPSQYERLSSEEERRRQTKIYGILSRRSKAINRALLFFILANAVSTPSLKVEYCLSQLANSGTVQSIAYQFYAFSIGIWPLLFIISFCGIIYAASKQKGSQEENLDRLNRRYNLLIAADNYVICIAATFAICGLVSEVAQNGWPAQYGTMLMINLALDLLLIALLRTFTKASELYSEHCIQRLYEEDAKFSYKEKFTWYDYKLVLMPLVLPIVKMYFRDLIQKKPQQHTTNPNVTSLGTPAGQEP